MLAENFDEKKNESGDIKKLRLPTSIKVIRIHG